MNIRSQLHSVSRAAMRGANSTGSHAANPADNAACAHVKSGLWKLLVAAATILILMIGAMEFFHGEAGKEFTRLNPLQGVEKSLQR